MFNAKNGQLHFDGCYTDYIRFGSGEKILIILPGLGDGLRTVKGMAIPMAVLYRKFAKEYTVYSFSRKNTLPTGYTTRDMASDLCKAMDFLSIKRAHLMGVSMGGMISQHFAAEYPDRVDKLILVVTCPRLNPILDHSVSQWISQAESGNHSALMDSNLKLIYSDKYYRQNKWLCPFVGLITKPKSYKRFLIQAKAVLSHDAFDSLPNIKSPTLIIGGEKDQTLGADGARDMHAQIIGSRLHIYPNGYHGLYEEEKDFSDRVLEFLKDAKL